MTCLIKIVLDFLAGESLHLHFFLFPFFRLLPKLDDLKYIHINNAICFGQSFMTLIAVFTYVCPLIGLTMPIIRFWPPGISKTHARLFTHGPLTLNTICTYFVPPVILSSGNGKFESNYTLETLMQILFYPELCWMMIATNSRCVFITNKGGISLVSCGSLSLLLSTYHLFLHVGWCEWYILQIALITSKYVLSTDTVPNDCYRFWPDLHLDGHV